ncbi:hypothetical protein G9P44_005675 [Scheffersomyces stipitis]|nr:hypothetical protein G9P44_005675 [Scheffersomyces stipitis]
MVSHRLSLNMPPGAAAAQTSRAIDESIFELKEVHNTIKYDWPQFLVEDANPIEVAVALLDDTSVGLAHRFPEFQHIMKGTETALRHVVNEHHELFNNSIGSYHLLLSTLQDSHSDAGQIKQMLESTAKDVQDRSESLTDLSVASARYSEMIEILDAISEVTAIPNKIDQLVEEKKIHEVYDVISNGYKIAEKYNLWSLSAMGAMQSYLEIQSNNLFDMIVDELQNEIYQKGGSAAASSNSNTDSTSNFSSWMSLVNSSNPKLASFKALVTESHNLEQYVYNSANLDISEVVEVFSEPVEKFVSQQLPSVHAHYSSTDGGSEINYSILLDAASTSSAQSFHYIYMLLHTAAKLSRLHQVIEILINSNQSELHGLISRATETVKSRNGIALAKLAKLQNYEQTSIADVIGNNSFSDSAVVVLQDLFGSIFCKALAVFQRHKVVSEVVNLLESGQSLSNAVPNAEKTHIDIHNSSYNLLSVWNMLKKELQALVLNYIHGDSLVLAENSNELLKVKNKSKIYDILSKKDSFRFEDVSYKKSTKTTNDLSTILQDMFPGFVLQDSSGKKSGLVDSSSPYIQNENFNAMVEVLVPKNLYNMRIILEPFLIFIEGSQRLFSDFSNPTKAPANKLALQFFDDFMKISFLSHVRESLEFSFREYIGGTYIRSEHDKGGVTHITGLKLDLVSLTRNTDLGIITAKQPADSPSSTVIYENALNFKKIFLNICSILNTSLTYRREFSDTALNFLESFAMAYNSFYQELLSTGNVSHNNYNSAIDSSNKPTSRISRWMRIPALTEISGVVLHANASASLQELEALIVKENAIILSDSEVPARAFDINKDDLLDVESFNQVCYLLLTTSWILKWLPSIKKQSNYSAYEDDDTVKISVVDKLRHNWSFLENGRSGTNVGAGNVDVNQQNIFLALNSEKIQRFDELVQVFESIRDKTLLALRYDLRCKSIYYIGRSFKESDWIPTTEPGDADPPVALLNKEVFSIDAKLSKTLTTLEREGIFVGLPAFLNQLLIQGSILVHKVNTNGIKRILLNIFTLSQMLRNLSSNPETVDFNKSSKYFELFTMNEFNMLNQIRANEQKFTLGELNNMARLIYSEKLADGNGTQFNKTKYSDLLKKISELVKS